jgi:cell division septum initiation protein DivIVA
MTDEQNATGIDPGTKRPLAAMADLPRPDFDVRRRGYDPAEVDTHLAALDRDRDRLLAELARLRNRNAALTEQAETFDGAAAELDRAVALGQETADAIVTDARQRATEIVAIAERDAQHIRDAERRRMAEEDKRLDGLRMAVAAEAAHLEYVTERMHTDVSEPAARLWEIVDGIGGLRADSEAARTLLEFAELLHRTNRFGSPNGGAASAESPPQAGERADEADDGPAPQPSADRLLDELAARTHAGG